MFLVSFEVITSYCDLHVTQIDTEVAQGRYTLAGVGIVFNSSNISLSILDLNDNEIISMQRISSHQQLIIIQEKVFIQVYASSTKKYRDYYVPQYLLKDTKYVSEDSFKIYKDHKKKLQTSLEELLNSFYADLIRKVAYSLGNDLRIYGNHYPSILPFYLVAAMLERMDYMTTLTGRTCTKNSTKEDNCFDKCPPCPENECLSLCGYGCHCWKWVCGDCCYHLGCHGHDICCRKNFIQTKCLFPIGFKCESEYYC